MYFSDWKFRIESLLDEKECLNVLTESRPTADENLIEVFNEKDRRARGLIIRHLGQSALTIAKENRNQPAKTLWQALGAVYENNTPSNQLHLLKQLMYSKMKEEDKIEKHFAEMDRLVSELRAAKVVCAQDPQFLSLVLLLSMPPSFDTVVTAITVMTLTELTYEGVKAKLQNYNVN